MSSTERAPATLRSAAAPLLLMALLGACNMPAGSNPGLPYGRALSETMARQVAYPPVAEARERLALGFSAATQDTVTFAFGSAVLDAEARAVLDAQAAWLTERPEAVVTVVGHADRVGGEAVNEGLGLRRAQAVARHLMARGVVRERIRATETRGSRDPAIATAGPERQNRRAVTEISGVLRIPVGPGLSGRVAERLYDAYAEQGVIVRQAVSTDTGG